MKPYIKFIFILILVGTLVSAQPPFQQTELTTGINIESPVIETLQQGQDYDFHIHAHNATNGLILTNSSIACIIHVYNSNGNHIIKEDMIFDADTELDFSLDALGGNFSEMGQYAVLFYCDLEPKQGLYEIGGFFEHGFEVTADGQSRDKFPVEFSIILFAFLLIAFGITEERRRLFKYAGSVMFMVMGVRTAWEGYGFINYSTLTGQLLSTVLIATGFYFLIEDSFSRDEQERHFTQKGGGEDEELE